MRAAAPLLHVLHAVNRARRTLYRRGALKSRRLPRPVISIGNLSMGGSGKTPATITIARRLVREGLQPAILSRGYRRRSARSWEVVTSDDVVRFGDEPVMLARALPNIPVIVGADRHASASEFLKQGDCDVFLLDDGFQHLQLARDCNILIVAPGDGFAREDDSAMADADLIIMRKGATAPVPGEVRTFEAELVPTAYRRFSVVSPVDSLRGRAVVAFSGLARNEQFFSTLRTLGADVRETVEYRDHHHYTTRDVELLLHTASEHSSELVTTEKDWVKIRRNDIGVVEATLAIEGEDEMITEILRISGLSSGRHR